MAGSHELVAGGTSFGLRALRGQQVTETGRAADQLTRTGYLEALGNGLFCLLHGGSGPKQRGHPHLAGGNFSRPRRDANGVSPANFSEEKSTAPQMLPKIRKGGLTCIARS